jgi:hypothetical protein
MERSQEKIELVTRATVLTPDTRTGSTTEDIVQAMSQVSLKETQR